MSSFFSIILSPLGLIFFNSFSHPLTQELSIKGLFIPLMQIDCSGFVPVGCRFGCGWQVESVCRNPFWHFSFLLLQVQINLICDLLLWQVEGKVYEDVDLSREFELYDEEGSLTAAVYNARATFEEIEDVKGMKWQCGRNWSNWTRLETHFPGCV